MTESKISIHAAIIIIIIIIITRYYYYKALSHCLLVNSVYYALSFCRGQMISQEDFIFIRDYDNAQTERRDQLIQTLGPTCAKTFIRLMGRIAKEMTVRYILTTIDDMLKVISKRVDRITVGLHDFRFFASRLVVTK